MVSNEKLNEVNTDINKARKKFLTDKVGEKDYYEFKKECELEMERIELQLIKITNNTWRIDLLLRKAVENLANLVQLYENADVNQKRKIIGSIYPEKIIFDGMQHRTTLLNEAVALIYSVDKGCRENKNGQIEQNFDLSSKVPRNGFEPSHPCERCDLNTVRLPISPPGQVLISN